jgi:NADH dehydrogenase/NADH:ubiquinone oxidoreductase subunit G
LSTVQEREEKEKKEELSTGQKKEIEFLSKQKKKNLTELMKEEKKKIEEFVKSISDQNYEQQFAILMSELHNDADSFIERNEKISAKFAWKSVNNIESFIVSYLNRLIHGLTSVSKKLKVAFGVNLGMEQLGLKR